MSVVFCPADGADFKVVGPLRRGPGWAAEVHFPWTDNLERIFPRNGVTAWRWRRSACERWVERAKAGWLERNGNPQLPARFDAVDPPIGGLEPIS